MTEYYEVGSGNNTAGMDRRQGLAKKEGLPYMYSAANRTWPPSSLLSDDEQKERTAEEVKKTWMSLADTSDTPDYDPIVERVRQRMKDRSDVGMKKYGVTMRRDDLSTVQWIDHAIEEALDFAVYMERIKDDIVLHKQYLDTEKSTREWEAERWRDY